MNSKYMSNLIGKTALAAFVTIGMVAAIPAMGQKFSIKDTWKIGGEGGWDYLLADSGAHRLYVTHGPRVEVIDTTTGKPVGAITGLKGTHGIALDPDGKLGYISDGGGNSVVIFDRSTLQTVATIPVGANPDGILFEPVTKTVWAFNGRSKNVSVIDTATRKVAATIALPGKPEFPAADGTGIVYDNIEDTNEIVKLDAKTLKMVGGWKLPGLESPSGLVMDTEGKRLFAVCDGKKMAVVDAKSGKLIATPAIGDGPDAAGIDPARKLVFSSNGEGTLTVVDESNYKVLQTLTTKPGARTMAYDAATGTVYLVTAEFGPRPAATAANPHPRPSVVPGSFSILVVGHE